MPDLSLPIDKVSITQLRNQILEESDKPNPSNQISTFQGFYRTFGRFLGHVFRLAASFFSTASFSELRNPILSGKKLGISTLSQVFENKQVSQVLITQLHEIRSAVDEQIHDFLTKLVYLDRFRDILAIYSKFRRRKSSNPKFLRKFKE